MVPTRPTRFNLGEIGRVGGGTYRRWEKEKRTKEKRKTKGKTSVGRKVGVVRILLKETTPKKGKYTIGNLAPAKEGSLRRREAGSHREKCPRGRRVERK